MPTIFTFFVALVLTAPSTVHAADNLLRLDGAFEIRVPAGMVVAENCFERTPMANISAQDRTALNTVCLERVREDAGRDYDAELLGLLSDQGWSVSGGAANALTLERMSSAACVRQLTLIALPRVADASIDDWNNATRVVHVMALHDEHVCDEP